MITIGYEPMNESVNVSVSQLNLTIKLKHLELVINPLNSEEM